MQTIIRESGVKIPRSMPSTAKAPDIASASVPDMLAALHVNPETGLTRAEAETRLKKHGYNEVVEQKRQRLRVMKRALRAAGLARHPVSIIEALIRADLMAILVVPDHVERPPA
jgi:magnesium-transporting ATPase (P-type)